MYILDGSFVKRTSCIIEGGRPREHNIRTELNEYQTLSTTVKVKENEMTDVDFPLTKITGTGSVERSVPKTANIYLDGIWRDEGLVTDSKVDAGMHKVLFELKGYESKLIDGEVVSNKVFRITETLKEGVTDDSCLGKTGISVKTNTHASVYLYGDKICVTLVENYMSVMKNGGRN